MNVQENIYPGEVLLEACLVPEGLNRNRLGEQPESLSCLRVA